MSDMGKYKYSLVRFFPNPIRDEAVNVGLILHSATERYFAYRFDLRRVASKLARADKDTFKHFDAQLEPVENEDVDWEGASFETLPVAEPNFLEKLADYMGNKIRFGVPRGCLTEDPDRDFDDLFERFVSAGRRLAPKVTKRTIVRQVKDAFRERGVEEYVKSKPTVVGEHRNYTLPVGIRHLRRTFVEVLNLGDIPDKNYRAMAAVGRLWQDARRIHRAADLYVVVHYLNGRLPEGETLLAEDGAQVLHRPTQVLTGIDFEHVRAWE